MAPKFREFFPKVPYIFTLIVRKVLLYKQEEGLTKRDHMKYRIVRDEIKNKQDSWLV